MKFTTFMCVLVMSLVFGLYDAWLFVDLWKWFIVPVVNVNLMNVPQAFGFLIVIGWFTTPVMSKVLDIAEATSDSSESFERISASFNHYVICSGAFTFAWLVSKYLVLQFI